MNPEELDRLKFLCEQIAVEQDHSKFVKLVQELNDFLEHKGQRLEQGQLKAESNASSSNID